MTKGNNLIITISGVKGDGKTTLGLFYLERLDKPSIIIDVTEQFEANRAYKKVIHGVSALKYELSNKNSMKLFRKCRMQLIFRPTSDDIKKEIEEVIQFVLSTHN